MKKIMLVFMMVFGFLASVFAEKKSIVYAPEMLKGQLSYSIEYNTDTEGIILNNDTLANYYTPWLMHIFEKYPNPSSMKQYVVGIENINDTTKEILDLVRKYKVVTVTLDGKNNITEQFFFQYEDGGIAEVIFDIYL